MPAPRHLTKAPITEALIDFRVRARDDLTADEFAVLKEVLEEQFPVAEERHSWQTTLQLSSGKSAAETQDLGLKGYFLKSQDGKNIAQFRTDGFTFNRLKPYTSFEEVFPTAMNLWMEYCKIARPQIVTRLAMRYINHLTLPPSLMDFDEYLRAAPPIPEELPQFLSGFLSRITIHSPDRDLAANVAQILDPNSSTNTVILDIDVYRQCDLGVDDPAIEETMELLRVFKNEIFFSLLTESALADLE